MSPIGLLPNNIGKTINIENWVYWNKWLLYYINS